MEPLREILIRERKNLFARQGANTGWLLTWAQIASLFLVILLLPACSGGQIDTPRLATKNAETASTPTNTPTPFLLEAPESSNNLSSEIGAETNTNLESASSSIVVWVNSDNQNDHQVVGEIVSDFSTESGIHVDLVFTPSESMPELMQTAVISGSLPDVVFHPIEFSHGWLQQGILDGAAATKIADTLGRDTFDKAAMSLLEAGDGVLSALPVHTERQLIIYRQDWLSNELLAEPADYSAMKNFAEAVFEPESNLYGLVVPTDSTLASSQLVFEQFALANGCEIVNAAGEVSFLNPTCLEALEYYRSTINEYSPIGVQTDISTLNAYLAGRTAMIVTSASALPLIAGLNPSSTPTCPDCVDLSYLAENSGIQFTFEGSNELASPTGSGSITSLGITTAADKEAAAQFLSFWFNQGYARWFAVNPERKVPLRLGTPENASLYMDLWLESPLTENGPTLNQVYGPDMVEQMSQGANGFDRWGFKQKQGEIIYTIYKQPLLSPLLQEMLSGYINSSQTVIEIYLAVIEEIPDYQFDIQVNPLPTATP